MLLGTLSQLKEQIYNHDNLAAGIKYLLNFDAKKEFADITPDNNRKVEIVGTDVFAIIQTYEPKSWDNIKFEGHRKYIDIQCVFEGEEKLLHAGIQRVTEFGEFNVEKDIHFSTVDRYSELLLTPGDACILFPDDMHAPCMKAKSDDLVKKVVVKVALLPSYNIVSASEDDVPEILHLQKSCYLSEAEFYNNYSIQPLTQTLDYIKEDFSKKDFYKITQNGRIIASVRVFEENDTCFIGKLIVDRLFQNRGIAKTMMNFVFEKYNHVKRFELFTAADTVKNVNLYQKLGFKEFKREVENGFSFVYFEKYN